jgi:AhpD family alkylhydroperoxidase
MTDQITARRGWIRVLLIAVGVPQLATGVWALLAPHSFYGDFPTGQGWVAKAGAYDEHLVRDVGALFIAISVIALVAAVMLTRRTVILASVGFLLYSVPHLIYHALNLGPFSTQDAVSNIVSLGAAVIVPVIVLWLLRGGRPAAPRAAAAGGPNGIARIAGVPTSTRNPLVRYAFRESRRQTGAVVDPLRVFAHHPATLAGYGVFELATERSHRVDARLKDLAVLRTAMLTGCEWCLDFGSAKVKASGFSEQELRALPVYRDSDLLSELDKLVLDYATAMSRTPVEVSDELFDGLRAHFDEAQLVELTSIIALENYRSRFNHAFGIGSQGFSEGAYCVRPEAVTAA